MNQLLSFGSLTVAVSLLAASCNAAPSNVANSGPAVEPATAQGKKMTEHKTSVSERFADLDAYLAWLEKTEAPVDGAWYKQVSPGVYELQTGNLRILGHDGEQKQRFTREELERKFGFRK